MGTPTSRELALEAELGQLRERLALLEHGKSEERQAGEAELTAAHQEAVLQGNRLRALLDALPVGVALIDSQGGNVETNAAFEQVWGGPRPVTRSVDDYAAYKAWWGDTGKPVQPEEWASARAVYQGETVTNQAMWIERFDGGRAFVLNSAAPIRDAQGRICGSAVALLDTTTLQRSEAALRQGEEQLASIYNTVRDVIFYLAVEPDGHFRFVSVNAAFLAVTGLSRESVVGKSVDEVIPEPSLSMVLERYTKAVREKTAVSWEETSDYPAGRLTGVVNIAPVLDKDGACTHLVGSVHDITERKRAEARLRESEERFRTVADNAPVMIWVAGLDKLCTFFNQPWLEFTGRSMQEELGNGWADRVHPDDMDRCLATYSSAFDTRRSFQMEYRLRRADGEYRWLLDNGTPRYREGQFMGYIGSCIDISDKRRDEEEMRSNQAQLADSQRLAKVGSWDLDLASGRTRWSEEWRRILGLPREVRLDLETVLSCVHPKDRPTVMEKEKKSDSDAPFRIVRPGGEVRFIRSIVEAIKDRDGAVVRLVGAGQDITDQVQATELLRESETRLKIAERLTHVGNWAWDIRTNQMSWSEEVFRILGQPPDYQPDYDATLDMVAPADRQRTKEWLRDCLDRKRGSSIEIRIVRPSGDSRTVVCTSEVLLDDDGSADRIFGACQDVTDAKRAQEESFGRQKLESLGTLAGGIAHDFNNLLGAVLAQTELAMGELANRSRAHEQLKEIRDVAIRGSEIVRQLMIYAGKESDVLELVDVSKAVQGMLGLLKVVVSWRATLVTDLPEGLPAVNARAAQVRQIVMNLVVNSVDAMDHEGMIRVTTRCVTMARDPGGEAGLGLPPGEYVELEVSDEGSGMSAEVQANIFDPFFTTKSAGRGLGLAVVDGIVRSLSGSIRLVSGLGKGTTVQILLPCARDGEAATPARSGGREEGAAPTPAATVLIVEDEHPLRLAVTKMLVKAGFGVLEADNGSDAIVLLRAKAGEIDVILLDLTIPGASSGDVLANAAQLRPNIKVIVTSAYSEETARARLHATQVCDFIRKPFPFATLMKSLRRVLSPDGSL